MMHADFNFKDHIDPRHQRSILRNADNTDDHYNCFIKNKQGRLISIFIKKFA